MATFVLNDESKLNSYGFSIPNKGINLQRFKNNPVMLDQHYNSTSAVLGKWKNIRVEGSQLLADDDFDEEDEAAKKVKGKVDRGYIKGASMGVTFNREQMQRTPDGNFELSKCELYEASIVAVPSNQNAVRLFVAETGELITENEVKLTLSALTKPTNFNTHKMEKLVLSAAVLVALGLNNAEDIAAVGNAVSTLAANYNEEKRLRLAAEAKLQNQSQALAKTLVDDAIVAGKFTAAERESYLSFATHDYENAAKVISRLPGKKTLGAGGTQTPGAGEVRTMEDFQKLTQEQQLAFKQDHADAYKKMFA